MWRNLLCLALLTLFTGCTIINGVLFGGAVLGVKYAAAPAGPLAYSGAAEQGQVVDAETGLPLAGAVVVVDYRLQKPMLEGTTTAQLLHVQETVTDEHGAFRTRVWGPVPRPAFRWLNRDQPSVLAYKAGYEPVRTSADRGKWDDRGGLFYDADDDPNPALRALGPNQRLLVLRKIHEEEKRETKLFGLSSDIPRWYERQSLPRFWAEWYAEWAALPVTQRPYLYPDIPELRKLLGCERAESNRQSAAPIRAVIFHGFLSAEFLRPVIIRLELLGVRDIEKSALGPGASALTFRGPLPPAVVEKIATWDEVFCVCQSLPAGLETTIPAFSNLGLGASESAEAASSAGTVVTLDRVSYNMWGASLPVTCKPSGVMFKIGTTPVTCTATDADGRVIVRREISVIVRDTLPPTIHTLEPDPGYLRPDHRMVTVKLNVHVFDAVDPSPRMAIVSVRSDPPQAGKPPAWTITGPLSVKLRAESGRTDRMYTIAVRATDASGNSSEARTKVIVRREGETSEAGHPRP